MSKDKLIPELRFPEFDRASEWQLQPLRKVLIKNSKKNKSLKHNLVQSVSNKHGFINQEDYFDNRRVASKDTSNYYVIKKGYFAYNPSRIDVGSLAYQHENITSIISPLYVSFQANYEEVDDIFLLNWFFSDQFSSQLIFEGGVRNTLSYENLVQINITLPSIPEQQKIASCLSSLDELLAAHKDKLDALKDHKKGLLQNLFPQEGETVPKVRFPEFEGDGEWEIRSVDQNIDLISGITLKSKELTDDKSGTPILRGINITEGQIRHSDEMDKFYLGDISEIGKYLVKENDIVIGMDGSKVGKNVSLISKQDEGAILIQRVARIRAINSDVRYLYQHFFSNVFRRYVDNVNTSSGIPHISAKQIRDFEIGFPPTIQEQQKIASCLSAVDELITAQQEKIEQLQQHKKGLMQGLFPKIKS